MKRVGAPVCGAPTLLNTESTDRTDGFRVQNKNALGKAEGVSFGSGRRIRTLTYGVRVRCATITQSRYVLANKNYYTHSSQFVNTFFIFFWNYFAVLWICFFGGIVIS